MKAIFTRKEFALAVACALAFGLMSEAASAQVRQDEHAIVMDAKLPIYEKVVVDANVLFDSDKSALRPAGRDTLDGFVASIRRLDSQRIAAIGYADRIIEVSGTRIAQ